MSLQLPAKIQYWILDQYIPSPGADAKQIADQAKHVLNILLSGCISPYACKITLSRLYTMYKQAKIDEYCTLMKGISKTVTIEQLESLYRLIATDIEVYKQYIIIESLHTKTKDFIKKRPDRMILVNNHLSRIAKAYPPFDDIYDIQVSALFKTKEGRKLGVGSFRDYVNDVEVEPNCKRGCDTKDTDDKHTPKRPRI